MDSHVRDSCDIQNACAPKILDDQNNAEKINPKSDCIDLNSNQKFGNKIQTHASVTNNDS